MQELSKQYVKEVAKIEKESFSFEAWSEDNILRELDNKSCVFRILLDKNEVIGYYSFYNSGYDAYINNLAIKKEFRGKGLSKILIIDIINEAHKLNLKGISLEVRKSNNIARNLYESMGFINSGIRPKFYNNTEDAVIYWYKVEE